MPATSGDEVDTLDIKRDCLVNVVPIVGVDIVALFPTISVCSVDDAFAVIVNGTGTVVRMPVIVSVDSANEVVNGSRYETSGCVVSIGVMVDVICAVDDCDGFVVFGLTVVIASPHMKK